MTEGAPARLSLWARVMRRAPGNLPVLADQIVASGANALAVLGAGRLLASDAMNSYALWQLAGTTLLALQRGLVSEPSMALSDAGQRADASGKYAGFILLPAAVAGGLITQAVTGSWAMAVAAASIAFVLLLDLLRFRAFGLQRPHRPLAADTCYLFLLGAWLLLWPPHDVASMLTAWAVPSAAASLALLVPGDGRAAVPLRRILGLGKFQVADWGLSTLTSVVPMFIIDRVVPLSSVGAFRLAQTITGPLNTISTFVNIKFLIDAGRLQALARAGIAATIRKGVAALVAVNLAYSVVAFVVWWSARDWFQPELNDQLIYALPLTLLATIISAPASVLLAATKALRQQRFSILPRAIVLVASVVAVGLGLFFHAQFGLDPLAFLTILVPVATTGVWLATIGRVLNAVEAQRQDTA